MSGRRDKVAYVSVGGEDQVNAFMYGWGQLGVPFA